MYRMGYADIGVTLNIYPMWPSKTSGRGAESGKTRVVNYTISYGPYYFLLLTSLKSVVFAPVNTAINNDFQPETVPKE